jgi:hypothetical protein
MLFNLEFLFTHPFVSIRTLSPRCSNIILIVTLPIYLNDNHVSTYRGLISISLFALQQRYDPCIYPSLRGDCSEGHRQSLKTTA